MQENQARPKPENASPELQQTCTQESMIKLVTDYPEVKKLLLEHLPEGQQTEEYLEANLRSSQLEGAMRTLTETINSDQAEIIFLSLGLDPKYIKECKDGMDALMTALIDKHADKKDEEKKD